MTFELFCVVLIALMLGTAITFNGYRWFLILLPIFAFVFGFGLGAQTMQAIFGQELFASVSSWVVGLIVGIIFAVLSYLFYFIGVGIFAASIGYSAGVALMQGLFNQDLTIITWVVGVILAAIMVFVVFKLNVQKYVIIVGSALAGATVIFSSLFFPLGLITFPQLSKLAMFSTLTHSPLWLIIYVALVAAGIYAQIITTRTFVLEVKDPTF